MSNFIIELDTTPPKIEIIAPPYTTQYSLTEIRIVSNERLLNQQEIYVIDSDGNRTNFTFAIRENELIGKVVFNGLPTGICTIYARCVDEVENVSDLVSKPINIIKSEFIKMKTSIKGMNNNVSTDSMKNSAAVNSQLNNSLVTVVK